VPSFFKSCLDYKIAVRQNQLYLPVWECGELKLYFGIDFTLTILQQDADPCPLSPPTWYQGRNYNKGMWH